MGVTMAPRANADESKLVIPDTQFGLIPEEEQSMDELIELVINFLLVLSYTPNNDKERISRSTRLKLIVQQLRSKGIETYVIGFIVKEEIEFGKDN